MVTAIECEACKFTREKKEVFLDLMVIPQKDEEEMPDLLDAIFSSETIEGLECDNCGSKTGNVLD